MSQTAWYGIYIFIMMFALIMIGVPIYLSMLSASLVGFYILAGGNMAITQFYSAPYTLSSTYTYAVMPMFMIVGVLAASTGIAGDAFSALQKWTAKRRGGLMYATIGANLIFGACSGASQTAIIVFGKVAYPELTKRGYNKNLSLGCITATSALSSLIPPSNTIVLFSLVAGISVGTALLSGIGPGIVVALLYCIMVFVVARIMPGKIPPVREEDRHVSRREKLVSLRLLLPILGLFVIIVGGIYLGWFPATVGGAIGAVAVIVYALCTKVPLRTMWNGIREAGEMYANIFPLIISGSLFSRVISYSGLADELAKAITRAHVAPFWIFTLVVIFYLLCGCVMDLMSTIIITVPIVFPLLTGLGYSEFLVCVVLVFMCEIGALTPPIGMAVFCTSNVLRIDPMDVFRGILPFIIVDIVMVFLMILFPAIVTFIPTLLS